MGKKHMALTFFLLIVIFTLYIMNFKTAVANFMEKKPLPPFDDPGQRILVIVPHPDDETLGMAGIIQRAIALNRPVKVVVVTDGESYKKAAATCSGHSNPTAKDFYELGLIRQKESIAAMSELNLPRKDLIFLGFADGSTRFLWSDFWDNDKPRVSGGTHVAYSLYSDVYKPGIPYTGQNLVNCLQEIISTFKPTDIYYPQADDIHPDHWAVSNFVRYTITAMNINVQEHMFLTHHPQWPVPWLLDKNKPLLSPVDMKDSNSNWQIFELNNNEINKKELAVKKYKTQIDVMEPFLLSFVRKNELFATKPVIKIPVLDTKPDLMSKELPCTLLKIQTGGILSQEIYRSADLTKLSAFTYNNHMYIGMQCVAPISKKVLYHIEMRLFYKNDIKRIDLGLVEGKMYQYKKAENSLTNVMASKPLIYKNTVWVNLNIPNTHDIKYIFMGADSIYKGRLIDKIPWNMYRIQ
ncbi:MAG: PIG-L family deacetylase [Thermoanaerobacteraceae bacterium]|nr:PIG-L family deacetylase [Thermoanaerobacteraceae bacterium]